MSISIPGRIVVFDYGEVISRSPSLAAALGATTHHFISVEGLDAFLRSLDT